MGNLIRLANHFNQKVVHANQCDSSRLIRVFVDVEKRFLYNRIKKNANTYIMGFLYQQTSAGVVEQDNLGRSKRDLPNLNSVFVADDLKKFRSLLVVRDPSRRALSAFLDKMRIDVFIEKFGEFELTPKGFENFVSWLGDGGLEKDLHWDLQTRDIVFDLDLYTDVVKFENLDQLEEVFREAGYDTSYLNNKRISKHGTHHGTKSHQHFRDFVNDKLETRLFDLYKEDYEKIGLYD